MQNKKYLNELNENELLEILNNNSKFYNYIYELLSQERYYLNNEYINNLFTNNYNNYMEFKPHYDTFYIYVKNEYEFIKNIDIEYLSEQTKNIYNEIIKNENNEEKYILLCQELSDILTKELQDMEEITSEEIESELINNIDYYKEFYTIDKKIYKDITQCYY